MAARAIAECFAAADDTPANIPILVCIAEAERPGRFEGLAHVLLEDIERELGTRLHPHSRVIEQGRIGAAVALLQARRSLVEGRYARMIVAGVDSFLAAATLAAYDRDDAPAARAAIQTALFPAKPLVRSCWQRGTRKCRHRYWSVDWVSRANLPRLVRVGRCARTGWCRLSALPWTKPELR